jgi:adenylyl-sulfate kinase
MPAFVVWFTGFSGAGKTTLANALALALRAQGYPVYVLDGDSLRQGLCRDLGFDPASRAENLRRAGEVSRLMVDAGVNVLAAFITPLQQERDHLRVLLAGIPFIEVHVSTPLHVCESRDCKGLYQQARAGKVRDFTGVDAPYEPPTATHLAIDTSRMTVDEAVMQLLASLKQHAILAATGTELANQQ